MPEAKTITVKARGIYDTSNNPWAVPDGAMVEALNVEILQPGVLSPRPGTDEYAGASYGYSFLTAFGDYVVGRRSTTLAYTSDGVTWNDYTGSYTTLTAGAQSAKSLFVPTTTGVYVLDAIAGTPAKAGVAPGLDIAATVSGAGTAIPNNTQVAYRAVFGRRDANGRVLLGAPSSRAVLKNTAGSTQNASVVVTLPADVQNATHFVQLYRTGASVDQNTDPGDECYLVYEAALSAVATVTITDSTPDGLGGASLYTNPSQETILGGNAEPPLAYDLAEFGGSLWYADVTFPARQTIYLLGVSGTNGLALNDTITVNGQVFTAKAAETVASREFLLATAGTTDENMRATAASLIKCINRTAAANAYAMDLSEPYPAGIPGVISIQRNDRTNNLTLAVSRATAWSGIVATTTPIANRNGLVYSKTGQPDQITTALATAPILVGTALEEIQRIIPTRNALWVLKQDGIWRVTGNAGQFEVTPFDPTVKITGKLTAVALNNQVYFLSDQGVVRVSESGVEIISPQVNGFFEIPKNSSTNHALSFAAARERRGQYILWKVAGGSNKGFVYHLDSEAWTTREEVTASAFVPFAAIEVGPRARLIVSGIGKMVLERDPSLTYYHSSGDGLTPKTLTSPTPTVNADGTVTLSFGAPISGVNVNDQIIQNTSNAKGRVRSVASTSITLDENRQTPVAFTTADVVVHSGIQTRVSFFVRSPSPGDSNEWIEADWLFGNSSGGADPQTTLTAGTNIIGTATFATENGSSSVTVDRAPSGVSAISVQQQSQYGAPLICGQVRVTPGRDAAFGAAIVAGYEERAAYGPIPDTITGLVLKFIPGGDGASR